MSEHTCITCGCTCGIGDEEIERLTAELDRYREVGAIKHLLAQIDKLTAQLAETECKLMAAIGQNAK